MKGSELKGQRNKTRKVFASLLLLAGSISVINGFVVSPNVPNNRYRLASRGAIPNDNTLVETDVQSIASESDEAPCFDGQCISNPSTENSATDNTAMGEATRRLGKMTGPTVWTEFGRLSQEHEVANLGQGFPNWLPPKFAVDSLVEAALDSAQSPHQYTRTAGHPKLVKQLARRYSTHLRREVDPMNEVSVTIGASQALYLSLQTLITPGGFFCAVGCLSISHYFSKD